MTLSYRGPNEPREIKGKVSLHFFSNLSTVIDTYLFQVIPKYQLKIFTFTAHL